MESSLPEWMTKEFFEQCLRKEEGNSNIVVTNLTVSSAAPPGNNYGSYIIRVALEWKTNDSDTELRSSKFIVKAELTEGPIMDMMNDLALNEPSFYYNFLPKAKQITLINFAAKSFFSPKSNVTILEDLKEKGFLMADRTKQLDFDHCRLYMIAAAAFHSVSVPVFKKHPEILEPINKEPMFSNESKARGMFSLMIPSGMKKFIEETEKIARFKRYTETVNDLIPHLWDTLVEVHKPSEVVNTIRQGDSLVTNMLFKYDKEGKVCDIKIIDFQGTGYGSPVGDVVMFLWSSATIDVKKNNLEELYRIYVESFNENLKQFNCTERLSHEQMTAQVKKLSPMALFVSVCFLPCLSHPEPIDFSVFFSKENSDGVDKFFEKYYSADYCANFLPQVLETLEINEVFINLEKYKK